MSKPTVYIETSVISYLAARPSRDIIAAAHQQMTREWWEVALPSCDPFVSAVVLEEISRGDEDAVQMRLERIAKFPVLEVTEEIEKLAEMYFGETQMPEKARPDAYHLALATHHAINVLVSWNFKHILGIEVRSAVEKVNDARDLRTPIICTPEEAMEVGNDW